MKIVAEYQPVEKKELLIEIFLNKIMKDETKL